MAKLVSKTYGEALFQIILEREDAIAGVGIGDELFRESQSLMSILEENPEFDAFMKHPGIAKTEKLSVVENVFKDRISPELYEFLKIVVVKDRYKDLPAIMEYVSEKMKEHQRIGVAYVSTAVELSDAQKDKVQRRLLETAPYDQMEMHYTVEPELIGGMVIRIGDRVVDTSVKSRLSDLTKQLMQIQLG